MAGRQGQPAGIRQFLDIGTGTPTEPNLHQVAQSITAESRVVYVDTDPIVLRHAEALLDQLHLGRHALSARGRP